MAATFNAPVEEVQMNQSSEKYLEVHSGKEQQSHSHCAEYKPLFGGGVVGKERKLEIRPIIHNAVSFRTPRRHRMRGGRTHRGNGAYFCSFGNQRIIPGCLHSGITLPREGKVCVWGCSDNSGSPFYTIPGEQGRLSASIHMGEICSYLLKCFE